MSGFFLHLCRSSLTLALSRRRNALIDKDSGAREGTRGLGLAYKSVFIFDTSPRNKYGATVKKRVDTSDPTHESPLPPRRMTFEKIYMAGEGKGEGTLHHAELFKETDDVDSIRDNTSFRISSNAL